MPDNGNFMVAAYIVAAVILAGYGWSLWRKARSLNSSGTAAPR